MNKKIFIMLTTCLLILVTSACANDTIKQTTDYSAPPIGKTSNQEKATEHSDTVVLETSSEIEDAIKQTTDYSAPPIGKTSNQEKTTEHPDTAVLERSPEIKDATALSVAESDEPNGQSIPSAFDYLITKETDFCTAQQLFPNIQECKASNFVKYELEIAMPVNSAVAINYIFTNGKITVHDNTIATFMPSDDLYETRKIEDKIYYVEKGDSASDEHTLIFLDEEKKLVYMASMTNSNGDLKALANFIDLVSSHKN